MPRGGQHPEHPGYVAPNAAYDCAACVAWHEREYAFPPLAGLNAEAWNFYALVQDQQRAGGLDVLGLDYEPLFRVFEVYDVTGAHRRKLFERIVAINRTVNEHRAEQRRIEHERAKAKAGR